jgi:hypothetical protein
MKVKTKKKNTKVFTNNLKTTKESQNTSKNVKRIIIAIFIIFTVLTLYKQLKKPKSTPAPAPPAKVRVSEDRINITGVDVNDFTKGIDNPQEQLFITLSRTKDYHNFYIPSQEVFFISVVSYPFDEYRLVAEADFLDKLGITQSEACNLKVDETTPRFANPDKAGTIFKLSFCR